MSAHPPLLRRLIGFSRRFRFARRGAMAVEFAMLAFPFFALLCGIIEIGMIYIVATTLEDATNGAARQIRTGQTQAGASPSQTNFAATICGNLSWLGANCATNLSVDVRTFTQFSSVAAPQPVVNGVFTPSALTFNPGGPCDIVVVRSYYQWTLFTPMMNQALQTIAGGKTLITSAATFRNEPYATGAPDCSAPP
jgi:Flp pilus assembly protein TadG